MAFDNTEIARDVPDAPEAFLSQFQSDPWLYMSMEQWWEQILLATHSVQVCVQLAVAAASTRHWARRKYMDVGQNGRPRGPQMLV